MTGEPLGKGGLPVLGFVSYEAFDRWLAEQPRTASGLWLKLAKQASGSPSITKTDAIDAALCHGWIDGQLDRFDAGHSLVRFTPRRARSKWSRINRDRAERLMAAGKMAPSGVAEVEAARADGRWTAAYEPASTAQVPADLQTALDADPAAAAFFATLRSANRYAVLYRIGTVKRAETRARKIAEFVAMLARGETIHG
jgi:uncharacterized protein YdeI (YjbR/CyaY-like superfamily)